MSEEKIAYLARAFQRLSDQAARSAREAREKVMAQAASKGELQSGAMLMQVGREYDSAAKQATDKMVHLTYELIGSSAKGIEVLERELRTLRDALSNELANFFRTHASWAPRNATDAVGNEYLNAMDQRITATIDDFRFEIVGGTKLTKDPIVSVVGSISNSPGAVLQSGIGNAQQATMGGGDALRSALEELLDSKEVQALTTQDKQSVEDVVEVITVELDKPNPDPSKLRRWGKRLLDITERLGVAIAASGIGHALFGAG